MRFEETAIENVTLPFHELEHLMEEAGFIRGGQWDWERVTYDFKFENKNNGEVYYLRVPGVAVEGEIEQPHAFVKLLAPILGRHYYPHGVEYEDEDIPKHVLNTSRERIHALEELIRAFQEYSKKQEQH